MFPKQGEHIPKHIVFLILICAKTFAVFNYLFLWPSFDYLSSHTLALDCDLLC